MGRHAVPPPPPPAALARTATYAAAAHSIWRWAMSSATDPSRLIAALARDRIALDLKTIDLCFLAGLYLRADKAALASFEEDALVDMFEQICDVVDPGAENPRKRATHAIQRLREQRMLARVDGAGIVRAGEYVPLSHPDHPKQAA